MSGAMLRAFYLTPLPDYLYEHSNPNRWKPFKREDHLTEKPR